MALKERRGRPHREVGFTHAAGVAALGKGRESVGPPKPRQRAWRARHLLPEGCRHLETGGRRTRADGVGEPGRVVHGLAVSSRRPTVASSSGGGRGERPLGSPEPRAAWGNPERVLLGVWAHTPQGVGMFATKIVFRRVLVNGPFTGSVCPWLPHWAC